MRTRSTLAAFAFTAVAIVGLAGCNATAGDGSGGDGDGEGPGATVSLSDCLVGSWAADIQDLGQQLLAFFDASGTPVTAVTSTGALTLDVDAATMMYTSDVTHSMTAVLEDGLEMIVTQTQLGVSSGDWTADESAVTYANWTPGITIETTISLGGQASGTPVEIPAGDAAGLPLTTSCEGDVLTTKPDGSPFTTIWNRIG